MTTSTDCIVPTADGNVAVPLAERGKLTTDEVAALAEATAQALLAVSADEAFAMLDRGELEGTHAEAALRSVRFLLRAI